MAINGNQWQSMAINGNQWQSMAINGNQWGQSHVCHEQSSRELWNCTEDGSRLPEVCLQGLASNRPVLLHSKGVEK
jgi:hypothetical protein